MINMTAFVLSSWMTQILNFLYLFFNFYGTQCFLCYYSWSFRRENMQGWEKRACFPRKPRRSIAASLWPPAFPRGMWIYLARVRSLSVSLVLYILNFRTTTVVQFSFTCRSFVRDDPSAGPLPVFPLKFLKVVPVCLCMYVYIHIYTHTHPKTPGVVSLSLACSIVQMSKSFLIL